MQRQKQHQRSVKTLHDNDKMAVKLVILNDDIISNFSFLFLLFAHSPYTQYYACRSSLLQQVRDQDDIFLMLHRSTWKMNLWLWLLQLSLYSQSVSLP